MEEQTNNKDTEVSVEQPSQEGTVTNQKVMKWPVILLVVTLFAVVVSSVAGYYAGRKSAMSEKEPTPTPLVTETPTPTETPEVTSTPTEEPTGTPTATPTPSPTVAKVKKTGSIKEYGGDYTLKFTFEVPADVVVSETKIGSWNGILMRRGTKAFMAFNLPYELYEQQGYSSLTNVASDTISNLRRVRSKKVFANSGSYSFAIAYVTPGSLQSGANCTDPVVSEPTSSPCAVPALQYGSGIGFSAYCSIDTTYLAICDQVMKTVKVVKE